MAYKTLEEARSALFSYIGDNWTLTPLAWQNVPRVDYADVARPNLDKGTAPFIEVTMLELPRVLAEVGLGAIRQFGALQIVTYVRKDSGSGQYTDIYDALQLLLEYRTVDFVSLRDMQPLGSSYVESWQLGRILFNWDFETARNA